MSERNAIIRKRAARCHKWGANVLAYTDGRKYPVHKWKPFQQKRQTADEAAALDWSAATGFGVVCGYGGFRCFDLDDSTSEAPVRAILDALGLPHDYGWVVRSGSGRGWHVWFRCSGSLPPSLLKKKENNAGVRTGQPRAEFEFDHLELRWERCQTVLPPSLHPSGGRYEFEAGDGSAWWPDDPPAEVTAERVAEAARAVCEAPKPPRGGNTHAGASARENGAAQTSEGQAVEIVGKAIDRAGAEGRNDTGLWLACQLRDNRFSKDEALRHGRQYVEAVQADKPGDRYTSREYAGSVEQAFSRPAREPWDRSGGNAGGEAGGNGRARNGHSDGPLHDGGSPDGEAADMDLPEIGVRVSSVERERIRWRWKGRLALGELTMADGDPGLGKSTIFLDVAARITTGRPLPGERRGGEPGGVVIVTTEDSIGHTIRPRLEAAGADLDRVTVIQTVPTMADDGTWTGTERVPVLPDDLPLIRRACEDVDASLLIIDPLFAHMGGEVDTFKDSSVRGALAPLPPLADELGLAVVAIRHLTKNTGGNPLYRGGGSIGIIGAARLALAFGRDPDDSERLAVASNMINIGQSPPTLALRLRQSEDVEDVAEVVWEREPCKLTADDLFSGGKPGRHDEATEEAEAFLKEVLAGGPRRSTEVHDLREERGISERTFYRAKDKLGVKSKQDPPVTGPHFMHPPDRWTEDEAGEKSHGLPTPYTQSWQSDQNRLNGDFETESSNAANEGDSDRWQSDQNRLNGDFETESSNAANEGDSDRWQSDQNAQNGDSPPNTGRERARTANAENVATRGIEEGGQAIHTMTGRRVTVRELRKRVAHITYPDGTKAGVGRGDLEPVPTDD